MITISEHFQTNGRKWWRNWSLRLKWILFQEVQIPTKIRRYFQLYFSMVIVRSKKPREAFEQQSYLYIQYILAFKQLEECYDQMAHPQKRLEIKQALEQDGRILKIKELKLFFMLNELDTREACSKGIFQPKRHIIWSEVDTKRAWNSGSEVITTLLTFGLHRLQVLHRRKTKRTWRTRKTFGSSLLHLVNLSGSANYSVFYETRWRKWSKFVEG